MRSVSLTLEPGSNVVTLVTPGDYTIYLKDLADLLAKGIGAEAESIGVKGGLTFYRMGDARPVSMRVLEPSQARTEWYAKLGSVVGPEPQYVSLAIDWRGAQRVISWQSDTWVAPPGSKAVRGAPNWPDLATAEEYRKWLGEVKTAETLSSVASAIEKASEQAKTAMFAGLDSLKWPIVGLSVLWIAYATRRWWLPKE